MFCFCFFFPEEHKKFFKAKQKYNKITMESINILPVFMCRGENTVCVCVCVCMLCVCIVVVVVLVFI